MALVLCSISSTKIAFWFNLVGFVRLIWGLACSNSVLGLHCIDEYIVAKTSV